ncbi:MAG: glycosyltransferase family 39 protein [Bryobacterales bacterium]|nr:glycosyltransferase family 39 protein [Bryobacterales bacterium]
MPGSRSSRLRRLFELLAAVALAAAVAAGSLYYFSPDFLSYGDAAAHLNIARRIVDSKTPGYEQIGTVWLPLPHVAMVPLVRLDGWWQTGLAGAIPSATAFVVAAGFLFASLRYALSSLPAWTGLLLFLLNPNALYLGSIPMTEPYFLATLFATLYSVLRASKENKPSWAAAAGIAASLGTLVRYEGWFLLPFFAVFLYLTTPRLAWRCTLTFIVFGVTGPLYWLAHNRFYYGDPLEFYHGPYSAKAIYQRALDAGMARYPGDHNWGQALLYFATAAKLVAGQTLAWLGLAGCVFALYRRRWSLVTLLALPPVFYVLSLYSSGTPIFVPDLWPHSYYNSRYGLAAFPLLCAGAAVLATRWWVGVFVVATSVAPWLFPVNPDGWICWKESQVNSEARRQWTAQAADYIKQNWDGRDILTSFGDLAAIYQQAGIPLAKTVHEGNGVYWQAVHARPDLFLRSEWVVAIAGDSLSRTIWKTQARGPKYRCVRIVAVKGAPVIEIYRRGSQVRLPQEEPPPVQERTEFNDQ